MRPGQELHPLIPPLWTTEYDRDGLDSDAFNYWHNVLSPIPPSDAERRNLSDLIPAWESGLDTVIVLPYAGYFARRELPVVTLQFRPQLEIIPPPTAGLCEGLHCHNVPMGVL